MAITPVQGKQIATASWAINALTASYLDGYTSPFPFTGSALITGSLGITGSLSVTQGITGSLFGTASWASNAISSSFATTASFAVSSSRAVTSSFAISSSFATTSSFAISSSFATSASFAISSSFATTSSFAVSSSRAVTSSFAISASQAQNAVSSSRAISSSFATIAGDASSINASITNNVDNYVLTATGTGVINGEGNLRFNGTTLQVLGSLQNGAPGNTNGTNSHTEGFKSTTYLAYSHAQGDSAFTGQDGYDVVDMEVGTLLLSSDYGNVTSSFTGRFILYDDSRYDNTYGFRRLQYTSVNYDGTRTVIFISDQTITTPSKKAIVGIPGVATLSGTKNTLPYTRTANHAEGFSTIADGEASHAEGSGSTSIGDYSHAEGMATQAIGSGSHTEGSNTLAVGNYSHAEGLQTQTINPNSHTEGNSTYTGQYGYEAEYAGTPGVYRVLEKYGDVSAEFTEGFCTIDDSFQDNTVGIREVKIEEISFPLITIATGLTTSKLYIGITRVFAPLKADKVIPHNKQSSHAEGSGSFALGTSAHAEGFQALAIGDYSHAEGFSTITSGLYSHAEGQNTEARGTGSHAEGFNTIASGSLSHAEGYQTRAIGDYSHAEGRSAQAIGDYSHAEGLNTVARGNNSHAEGFNTVTSGSYQHVQGQYNVSSSAQSAFIIGNGTSNLDRSNLVFASGSTFQVTGSVIATQGFTGSLLGTASYAVNALSSSNAATASFAPDYLPLTGGTIAGSLTINNNLTVLGSASIQYISESVLNIGTNLITVNTFDPAVRFGGLAIIDSGSSPQVSASFLYDSVQDEFIFVHRGTSTSAITSSHFLVGPETYNDLGNELYLTANRIPKSVGNEHLNDSNISDNGTLVSINSNTQITGSLTVVGNQTISGSIYLRSGSVINSVGADIFIKAGVGNNAGVALYNNSLTQYLAVDDTGSYANKFTVADRLTVQGSITGSLFGTSSWATNAVTASYITSSNVQGPFGADSILSASYALTASYALNAGGGGSGGTDLGLVQAMVVGLQNIF